MASQRHNKYFPYGPNSRLIRALLYTHTSKTTKSQCFPLLLWTEVQPVHTPVRTQAYGPALRQSNFSILSVFCLVYNIYIYIYNCLRRLAWFTTISTRLFAIKFHEGQISPLLAKVYPSRTLFFELCIVFTAF